MWLTPTSVCMFGKGDLDFQFVCKSDFSPGLWKDLCCLFTALLLSFKYPHMGPRSEPAILSMHITHCEMIRESLTFSVTCSTKKTRDGV